MDCLEWPPDVDDLYSALKETLSLFWVVDNGLQVMQGSCSCEVGMHAVCWGAVIGEHGFVV